MLPVSSVVAQAAGVVLLVAVVVSLVRAFQHRGTATRAPGGLERAQTVAITVGALGLALAAFVDSDLVDAIWVDGVVVAVVLAVVRWRRDERPLPGWF